MPPLYHLAIGTRRAHLPATVAGGDGDRPLCGNRAATERAALRRDKTKELAQAGRWAEVVSLWQVIPEDMEVCSYCLARLRDHTRAAAAVLDAALEHQAKAQAVHVPLEVLA